MRPHIVLFLAIPFIFGFILSCSPKPQTDSFVALYHNYKKGVTQLFPFWAAQNLNSFSEASIPVPNDQTRRTQLLYCSYYLDSLQQIDPNSLPGPTQKVYQEMKEHLDQMRWEMVILKGYEWNPSIYNVESLFKKILEHSEFQIRDRLLLIHKKSKTLPAFYDAAKANLIDPPLQLLDQAIQDHVQAYHFFDQNINDSLSIANLKEDDLNNFLQRHEKSKLAIKDFIAYCKSLKFDVNDKLLDEY